VGQRVVAGRGAYCVLLPLLGPAVWEGDPIAVMRVVLR